MAINAPRRATIDDLEGLPENVTGQIVDGELIVQPRPSTPHARSATSLGVELGGPFDRGRGGPGGWILLFEPELRLGGDVLVPDLAGWRRERVPEMPHAAYFELAPDWVCEVLSPATASVDRVKKLRVHGREQVAWYWLVDPLARTLEILSWQAGSYVVVAAHDGEETVRAPPFDAIELELPVLWRR